MVDSVYRTRSLGVAAEGLPDQYADGKAAKVWEYYIGSKQSRTAAYKHWITSLLKERSCQTVFDVACGTGVDSIMLLEEGFKVFSSDASDKMLKIALKERWSRRKEAEFDSWVIEEANWLTLQDDIAEMEGKPADGFDTVFCLGNSFAHMPDFDRNQKKQRLAIGNFLSMVKPGGVLLIDHRNYDAILDSGNVPAKNIYYNSKNIVDIKCSNLYVNGEPTLITLDYVMDMSISDTTPVVSKTEHNGVESDRHHRFRLSYFPHRLADFSRMLTELGGKNCQHFVYGDFKPLGEVATPAYYIHVLVKGS